MITNTQHERESTAVSFTPMTNRDKGSQPPPIRPFQPYKFVTLQLNVALLCYILHYRARKQLRYNSYRTVVWVSVEPDARWVDLLL